MEASAHPAGPARRPRLPLPLSRLGDERLARLVGRGDDRAFAALYERYHQTLYRYCLSMVRDETDAQDVLQSSFASALTALRAGRRDAPLRPWLYRITHNQAVTVLRRRRPQDELSETLPSPSPPVEEQIHEQGRMTQLLEDLRNLPDRQRAGLLMRELSGLSHEEIATALGTSPGTAKQTIYEARQALMDLEKGRAMSCDEVCRKISDGDGRALRGRSIRAHLRACPACAAFAAAIPGRSRDLRALTPVLPAGAAASLLARLTGSGLSTGGGGGSLTVGAAGKAAVGLIGAKAATGVAVLTIGTLGVAGVIVHAVSAGSPPPASRPLTPRPQAALAHDQSLVPGLRRTGTTNRSASSRHAAADQSRAHVAAGLHGAGRAAAARSASAAAKRSQGAGAGAPSAASSRGGRSTAAHANHAAAPHGQSAATHGTSAAHRHTAAATQGKPASTTTTSPATVHVKHTRSGSHVPTTGSSPTHRLSDKKPQTSS